MLSNLHTHSTFCDGQNTIEEITQYAIAHGFDSIGFSGHCTTPYDLRYCMRDTEGYIREVNRIKEAYKDKIAIYLGVEEDAYAPVERERFDYIIGSFHYIKVKDKYLAVDSNMEYFNSALKACNDDPLLLTETYYSQFCDYILRRKPDIIGHFDLLTKREETETALFFTNEKYFDIAEKYANIALSSGCIFEVNTGAMARGIRTSPYPHERILRCIQKNNGKVILSSDSHSKETLDYCFTETKALLRSVGFQSTYMLIDGKFTEVTL